MNSYPIKHQQKHHISEKTCPPMIDLIYNNLMNVNNKSGHEAIQGEGRGYPRPIEIPLYYIYMYMYCMHVFIGQFQKRSGVLVSLPVVLL